MAFKKNERESVYEKYNGHCAYCGDEIKISKMQVDHIIPQSNFLSNIKNNFRVPVFLNHLTENDVNHIDNLNPSCRVCNNFKSSFHLELFRNELQEQHKRAFRQSSNYRRALKFGQIKETPKPIIFYFETIN